MSATTDTILEKLFELGEGQASMKMQMETIQKTVTANTVLLRGNGVPGGIVTDIALLKEDIQDLKAMIPDEATCRKDMKALKIRVEDYPTYLWLLRNKFKSTAAVTGVILILFIFVVPLIDRGFIAAIFTWVGVPAALIQTLIRP